jgi:HEPN domain-containing protein
LISTPNPPLIEDALFHCQQAAEKSLKGYLTSQDKTSPLRKPTIWMS